MKLLLDTHIFLWFISADPKLPAKYRTAICAREKIHFNVGAGIVADSSPEAEYEETLAKAAGFLAALKFESPAPLSPQPASR